jgi:hypothetical protein
VAVLLVSLSLSHAQVHEHKTDMPVIVTLEWIQNLYFQNFCFLLHCGFVGALKRLWSISWHLRSLMIPCQTHYFALMKNICDSFVKTNILKYWFLNPCLCPSLENFYQKHFPIQNVETAVELWY